MCYQLVTVDVFVVCGHSRLIQAYVYSLILMLTHIWCRFIDCYSPNCAQSDYHTMQNHNCNHMCKQRYITIIIVVCNIYLRVLAFRILSLGRNTIRDIAGNVRALSC